MSANGRAVVRPPTETGRSPDALLLPLSAPDPGALSGLRSSYATFLDGTGTPDMVDVCFTAGASRKHYRYRAAFAATDRRRLVEALAGATDRPEPRPTPETWPRVVFVFPGQGGQWVGMGRQLFDANRVFRQRMLACASAVSDELAWSPIDRLFSDGPLTDVEEIQPLLWAIQVSLAALWQHWGVEPDLIIGHSMGEIAAATVAGALTLQDGATVAARRSIVVRDAAPRGAMWTVGLGEEEAQRAIGDLADRACVGVLNSANYSVLSGDPEALSRVVEPLLERDVFCRRVKVSYASHSPQVEPMRPALMDALAGIRPRTCQVPMHSTVWDAPVDGSELHAGYWMDNLRRPVRFADAVRSVLAGAVPTLFVEVSPHPTLVNALAEGIDIAGADATTVGSLERKRPELLAMLEGLGGAYTAGCDPLWTRVFPGGSTVPLLE